MSDIRDKKKDDFKKDYFVPNFGADPDIADTASNLAQAEKTSKHDFNVGTHWKDDRGNYAMVQTDSDMNLKSDPICSSAGCTQYKHKTKDRGYKIDYFVPHFGEDGDIMATKNSAGIAEKQFNHYNWPAEPADPPKRNYFVPNFGEDPEITATKKNIAAAEKDQGHTFGAGIDGAGSFSFVQTDADLK